MTTNYLCRQLIKDKEQENKIDFDKIDHIFHTTVDRVNVINLIKNNQRILYNILYTNVNALDLDSTIHIPQ